MSQRTQHANARIANMLNLAKGVDDEKRAKENDALEAISKEHRHSQISLELKRRDTMVVLPVVVVPPPPPPPPATISRFLLPRRRPIPQPPIPRKIGEMKPFTFTRATVDQTFVTVNVDNIGVIQEWVRRRSPPRSAPHPPNVVRARHDASEVIWRQHREEKLAGHEKQRVDRVERIRHIEDVFARVAALRVVIALVSSHCKWQTRAAHEVQLRSAAKQMWGAMVLRGHILSWVTRHIAAKRKRFRKLFVAFSLVIIVIRRWRKRRGVLLVKHMLRTCQKSVIFGFRRYAKYAKVAMRCCRKFIMCRAERQDILVRQLSKYEDLMGIRRMTPTPLKVILLGEAMSLFSLKQKMNLEAWIRERKGLVYLALKHHDASVTTEWDLLGRRYRGPYQLPDFSLHLCGRALGMAVPLASTVHGKVARPPWTQLLLSKQEIRMLIEKGQRQAEYQRRLLPGRTPSPEM